jgi:N6-L-threonylcarbamoyladenine synthase
MLYLGIETSCDETGLALYDDRRGIRGHLLHSQVALHREYGGVVPELASRDHARRILPLLEQLLHQSAHRLEEIDAIAYTQGPGLPGALLVGAGVAHGLAFALGKPALGIHHLEGHLLSPLLADDPPALPLTALLVSGGHTQLLAVEAVGNYRLLGETVDDAAGEAFDKSATLLGLHYPGGPALARLAEQGDPERFALPRPMLRSNSLDFSFSGLKTAVLTEVRRQEASGALDDQARADLAAGFQAAVVDVLVGKCLKALHLTGHRSLVVAGGVGANRLLRARLSAAAARVGARVTFPPPELCTDNGLMIAFAAALRHRHGLDVPSPTAGGFAIRSRWALAPAA